ncbi:MAG: AtpZ/AtpI family protein [Planctomycetes bacterium]|nr:AtpZ/AtpI family protein [Planctomycetota bacterium]
MGGSSIKRKLDAMSFLGVGFSFICEVGVLGLAGYWLDRRWDSAPWLLGAGIGLGMVLALTHLLSSAARWEEQERQRRKERDEREHGD